MADGPGSRRRHPASKARPLAAALGASLFFALLPAAGADAFRYGLVELGFSSSRDYPNPLIPEVRVEFAGPNGRREEVLAFWDGGRSWKVRFSPEAAGRWSYRVVAPDPADRGLHNRNGRFRVGEYKGSNQLYRRGAPRLAPDRRYFVHADGEPWFWLADTAWNGALLSTRAEWEKYLADRAARKFSVIQFVTTQWRAGHEDELGQVAFTGTEEVRVNPAFYRRMDERVRAVNGHGLVAAPVLLWALTSKDRESPGEVLPADQAALLARYMVARYGACAVLWLLGGDGDYRAAKAERWKTIGRAVFPAGRGRRPVTMHPRGMQFPWPEYKDEPWLDFFMHQSGHGNDARKWEWNATQGNAVAWKLEPPRPVIDGEINYEAHLDYQTRQPISDAQVRRAAYYSLLAAPPAGVTYGAHGIWPWLRKPEVPLDHPRSGVAPPWFDCLDLPGARQMRVLREVFDSVEWWKLRPDRSLLAEDPADPEFRACLMPARSTSGDFALIYLPGNPSLKLNLSGFARAMTGAWIDPRTGDRRPAGEWTLQAALELKTPGAGDWLLLVQAR